jgi:glycosyltransferase involved in cell wall biosynthesis
MSSGQAHLDFAVPAHDVFEFRPKSSRYCVCVFVLNEGARIRRQLERMRPLSALVDIVVADGGSTDGALEHGFLASAGVRALLVKRAAGRLGTQMRMAFGWALRGGYDGVITIDGNDKDDPEAVHRFIATLDSGVDHVQGSRFVRGGKAVNTPASRWLGIRFVHAPLISLAAGHWYTDTTNGFRAYSRRLLLDPRVAPFREVFAGYELHYYLAIRATRLGYRAAEVPVTRAYPASGAIPTKITGLRGNMGVLKALMRACFSRYNPTSQ